MSGSFVPSLWALSIRLGIWLLLEGVAARLSHAPALAGRPAGAQQLLGILAAVAIVSLPALALAGAGAILRAPSPAAPSFTWAFAIGVRSYLPALAYGSAGAAALVMKDPTSAGPLAVLLIAHALLSASISVLLAHGMGPWDRGPASRLADRACALSAAAAVVLFRVWRPEESLAPHFAPVFHLVFPFDAHGGPTPTVLSATPATPAFPVPPLVATCTVAAQSLAFALVVALLVMLVYRRSPFPSCSPSAPAPGDLVAPLITIAAILILLVLDLSLVGQAQGRARALILAFDEACYVVLTLLSVGVFATLLPDRLLPTAASALLCLVGATHLLQQEIWIGDWPTTLSLALTTATLATAAPRLLLAVSQSCEAGLAWALRLSGGLIMGSTLLITDLVHVKLSLRTAVVARDQDLAAWWITKLAFTGFFMAASALAPVLLAPAQRPPAPPRVPTGTNPGADGRASA